MAECCKATICSECFLQLQDCKISNPCPFCNKEVMVVKVAKRLEEEEVQRREKEEQRFIEASIKARHGCNNTASAISDAGGNNITGGGGGGSGNIISENGNPKEVLQGSLFGSNLNADLEKRSRTFSADLHPHPGTTGTNTNTGTSTGINTTGTGNEGVIAVAPEERRKLEQEMSSHNLHPLVRQMTADAERERERHELEYMQRRRERSRNTQRHMEQLMGMGFTTSARTGRTPPVARERDNLASLAERVSIFAGVSPEPAARIPTEMEVDDRPTIDDLLLFEAALFLSMREESSRRNGNGDASTGSGTGRNANVSNGSRRSSGLQGNDADASSSSSSSSQRPRARGFLSRRRNADRDADRNDDPVTRRHREARSFVQALLRQREFEQRPNPFIGYPGRDDGGLSPRESLLADLSEARQLEMAIQLSLQEAQGGAGDEPDHADAAAAADVAADAAVHNNDNDDNLIIDDQADHGVEEIIFDHQEDETVDTVVEPASSPNTTSVDNSPPVDENRGENNNVVGENEAVVPS